MRRDFLKSITMPVTKAQKKEILSVLLAQMKEAKSIVFADSKGCTVKDLSNLRRSLREKGVKYQIAKKTLIRIAAKELGYGDITKDGLEGSIGVACAMEDEIVGAKIINELGKKNKNLVLRGGLFNGKVLSIDEVKQLANLPSKQELLAKFVYVLKSPIQGFHGVLQGTLSSFVRALDAIAKRAA